MLRGRIKMQARGSPPKASLLYASFGASAELQTGWSHRRPGKFGSTSTKSRFHKRIERCPIDDLTVCAEFGREGEILFILEIAMCLQAMRERGTTSYPFI